jgi:protein-S-isoprenylcysteine O-methyltransferase Ste14
LGFSRKGFYVSPPILAGANSSVLLTVGILFVRKGLGFWDGIAITVGVLLLAIFFVSVYVTHNIKQIHMSPGSVDKLVTNGPYAVVRHPNYAGTILMNIAFLFLFRTLWLVPAIGFFTWLWYLEARYEERELSARFGDSYEDYAKSKGMFLPRLFNTKSKEG